jgi:DNA-directed RNA polymerase subunit RPC12/RpoP
MAHINCKVCNAEVYWDTKSQSLKCDYCGTTFKPEELEKVVKESATKTIKGQDNLWVEYKCGECGATMITKSRTMSAVCIHCGRALSLGKNVKGMFDPDLVIPFKLGKEDAINACKKHFQKSFLIPRAFKKVLKTNSVQGVYIPYWLHTFDLTSHIDFYGYKRIPSRKNESSSYNRYSLQLKLDSEFSRVPTDAAIDIDNDILDMVEPFDYSRVKKFHPGYLAGYLAQAFDQTNKQTFANVKDRVEAAIIDHLCASFPQYDYLEKNNMVHNVSNYSVEYALLPVWIITTQYRNQTYNFMVNGTTGKVAGKFPKSMFKMVMIAIAVFITIYLLVFLSFLAR